MIPDLMFSEPAVLLIIAAVTWVAYFLTRASSRRNH